MGRPVLGSVLLSMCAPAAAVPRKPCSGQNILVTLMPQASRVSTRWVVPTMEVWLPTTATPPPLGLRRSCTMSAVPSVGWLIISISRSAPVRSWSGRASPGSGAGLLSCAWHPVSDSMAISIIKKCFISTPYNGNLPFLLCPTPTQHLPNSAFPGEMPNLTPL